MGIGERIQKRRKELGLSVDDLAGVLEKSRATVYRYENNDIEKPPTTILKPLSEALNVPVSYLLGDESESDYRFNEFVSSLTQHEIDIITAYRKHTNMQEAVDKLLGI